MKYLWLALGMGVAVASCSDDGNDRATGPSGNGGAASSSVNSGVTIGSGGNAVTCFDYSTFNATPSVSFDNDVMPIFEASCNSALCHGSPTNPDGGLFLGRSTNNTDANRDRVYAALVDTPARREVNMSRVTPGDALNSFLMIKLDGEMSCPHVVCAASGCGARMPRGSNAQPLPTAQRDLVRSWILNGAPRVDGAGGAGGTGGAGGN